MRRARHPDQGGGLELFHRVRQRGDEGMLMGVRHLVLGNEVAPAFDHEPLRVDKPAAGPGLGLAQPLGARRGDIKIGNARAGFTRCSASLPPVSRNDARIPASATDAVPWMSSLKLGRRLR